MRAALHNIKITGEKASADEAAADAFPDELKRVVEEGGYTARQVFNIDETGLFWKRMPSRYTCRMRLKFIFYTIEFHSKHC